MASKVFGNIAEEQEYLRKFATTGGGEPIPKDEKWTTEERDPEQGRNPHNGQFIDKYSIGMETEYPKRGKNNVPYILRTLAASFLGFDKDVENLTEKELNSIVEAGTAFGTEDEEAVLNEKMTLREFLRSIMDGTIAYKAARRKGNYASQRNAKQEETRLGHRDQLRNAEGDIQSEGWEDTDLDDVERQNYYRDELKKTAVVDSVVEKISPILADNSNSQDYQQRVKLFTNRLKNLGSKLAIDYGRTGDIEYAKERAFNYLIKDANPKVLQNQQMLDQLKNNLFGSGKWLENGSFPTYTGSWSDASSHKFKRMAFTRKNGKLVTNAKGTKDNLAKSGYKYNALGDPSRAETALHAKKFDGAKYEEYKRAGMSVDEAKKKASTGRGNFIAEKQNRDIARVKNAYNFMIARGKDPDKAKALLDSRIKEIHKQYRRNLRKFRDLK